MQKQLPSSCPFFFFDLIDSATSDVSQFYRMADWNGIDLFPIALYPP